MPDAWIRQWGEPTLRIAASDVAEIDDVLRAQVTRMQRLSRTTPGILTKTLRARS